jgi:hypothetical protein
MSAAMFAAAAAPQDSTPQLGPQALRPPFALARAQISARATALSADGATWSELGADTPRFNGTARRLLIEGQRTNSIRNPRCEGAVAGTPGTMPTHWSAISGLPSGVASEVVGVFAVNGVQCLRLRLSGTPGSTANARVEAEALTSIAGANGQTWTHSAFLRIASGNQTNLGLNLRAMGRDSGFTAYNLISVPMTLGAALTRFSAVSAFANAAIAYATGDIQLVFTSGLAVDCTFDIGWPQFGQAAFASTLVLPAVGAPSAATRGADLVSATLASLGIGAGGACTILFSGVVPQAAPSGVDQHIVQVDDGSDSNRFRLRVAAGGSNVQVGGTLAGSPVTAATLGAMTPGTLFRAGITMDGAGRIAGSLNGGAVQAVTGGPTSGLTTLRVGNNAANTAALFGEVAFLRVLPYRLSDAALPAAVAALAG